MKTKMKILRMFLFTILIIVFSNSLFAGKRETVTVLNIDTHGLNYTPEQLGNLVRLELEKLDTFEVMDRYDVVYLVKKNSLDITDCYGKIGLVEVGKSLNSQKMLSGSVDLYGETIILSLRLVDIKTETIEKSFVKEFLNLPKEIQSMVRVSIREMYGLPNDNILLAQLTKVNNYESMVNTNQTDRLNLSGPRMGAAFFTGPFQRILLDDKENGGFELFPVMYQIGYQFEAMYLNEGNFQALFEFIPMITGIDQGLFLPSITIMNGLRHNLLGLEFAIGPNFSLSRQAEVFVNGKNNDKNSYKLKSDLTLEELQNSNYKYFMKADSRGDYHFSSSFVFAVGKTFKSGKMNFPVNIYFIPKKDGWQMGLSFGFNAKNRR
jgi:hypothetical protein